MRRGWEVVLNSGKHIKESKTHWKDVPKNEIKQLILHYDGRRWDVSGKEVYFQKKRGSAIPGDPNSFRIESRSIGYYEGKQKVIYTVNEFTGKMVMEVEDLK
jgi:hypothetical protein